MMMMMMKTFFPNFKSSKLAVLYTQGELIHVYMSRYSNFSFNVEDFVNNKCFFLYFSFSNTKPIQQQSAFSLRPKTGLRGSVAPRLHGSMDSMKHIPTAAPGNVPSDPNSEAAVSVSVVTDQSSNSGTTSNTVVAADQSINAAPGDQVADQSTSVVTSVKDVEKQPDKTIDGIPASNILEIEKTENSLQISSAVKEVEKDPLATGNTSKPAV